MDNDKRVADYFIISGVSDEPEYDPNSKQLIKNVLPITDITVIFKSLGEECPPGYTCIETTPGGHLADLNNGNLISPNIHICFKRGNDKPPLIEVGVYHEDKERVLPDIEVIYKTYYGHSASTGMNSTKSGTYITYRRAKTNSPFNQLVVVDLCVILNNKSEHPPHAFYSIKKNLNKSYYGMIGSEVFLCYKKTLLSPPSLCCNPKIISRFPIQDYNNFPLPSTVPLFCLPTGANIELWPTNTPSPRPVTSTFVLTSDSAQRIYGSALSFYEPFDSNLLSDELKARLGLINLENDQYDETENSEDTKQQKCDDDSELVNNSYDNKQVTTSSIKQLKNTPPIDKQQQHYETYAIKSICILSRWPFFDCFQKFLTFLHNLVFFPKTIALQQSSAGGPNNSIVHYRNQVTLEHHISHFLLDVSFPTPQRPTVMVQLIPGTDENVTISQPPSVLPLPLTGASFCQLLTVLGVENTMNVLLFGLSEQKILLHSLRPWKLTGVAEAISAMFFPFHWQCPYVPLCPLNLHGILNAPLPFIVGIDSRCFDSFTPPDDIICIDLDTSSIFLSELKKCLSTRILPKRPARVLRSSLERIFQKLMRTTQALGLNQSPQRRSPTSDASKAQMEKKFELEIQEAFVRFMATVLAGFRSYLLPITSAPTVGATDPTSLFDFEGFLLSRDGNYPQFYQLITKTQMFTKYIEERSFVSDKDTSLAFFDDCEERLTSSRDLFSDKPIKLFDKDESFIQTDRSVYIPAPEQSPSVSANNSLNTTGNVNDTDKSVIEESPKKIKFGPLNQALFHRHPQINTMLSMELKNSAGQHNDTNFIDSQILFDNHSNEPNSSFSIARRTKQEVKTSQKLAKKSYESPLDWSKHLVSCCYSLWFSALPSYIAYSKLVTPPVNSTENNSEVQSGTSSDDKEPEDLMTQKILRYAFTTLVRMQQLRLTTDEICFRVLTLLCGHHGLPDLAVQVFYEMKTAGIKPNAVTYGYYNKAVLEGKWPEESRELPEATQMYTGSVECLADNDNISGTEETRSNRVSQDSTADPSDSTSNYNQDVELDLDSMNIASTPNFNLSSLINDASNLQWSKWTSSQNSKSVYKGIKNAATGIVSSLQEIKSSFSISNSNTPSKLLTSAQAYTSSATKEMLSQWATSVFPGQLKEGNDESDNDSLGSNELIKLNTNEGEDGEQMIDPEGVAEASDFRDYQQLFQALAEYHSNFIPKEDLIDHISNMNFENQDDSSIAMKIEISTNSRCNACHTLLTDEEIMEKWSPNESNLNTKCIYCGAKIVPFMKISIEDRRFNGENLLDDNNKNKDDDTQKEEELISLGSSSNHSSSNVIRPETTAVISRTPANKTSESEILIDLGDDRASISEKQPQQTPTKRVNEGEWIPLSNLSSKQSSSNNHNDTNKQHNFTVPYLSPMVLRKELESVYESSGDSCLASSNFVDHHPIIFWNLLWYFNRIYVPTHLALLCLIAESILNNRKIPDKWIGTNKVVVFSKSRLLAAQKGQEILSANSSTVTATGKKLTKVAAGAAAAAANTTTNAEADSSSCSSAKSSESIERRHSLS